MVEQKASKFLSKYIV
jgi:tRNA-dihydrouridine synthase A